MPIGTKHVITCTCIHNKLKNIKDIPQHRFVVFSVVGDDDVVVPKYVTCDNCGVVHKVIDICKSEIIRSKENVEFGLSLDELKSGLPQKLVDALSKYNIDVPTWEYISFAYENQNYDVPIVVSEETVDNVICGKYLKLKPNDSFTFGTFTRDDTF